MRGSRGNSSSISHRLEGAPERHFHLGLRVHTEQQHRRGKRNRVVYAHAVHRPPCQLDLAVSTVAWHCLRLLLLVRNAAEQILIQQARLGIQQARCGACAIFERFRRLAKIVVCRSGL
jgi:hypothetical protein